VQQIDQGHLLASIAATSHDCILSADVDGTVLWASPATLDGSELAVLMPRRGGDVHAAYLRRLLGGERVVPFLDAVVRRDGSTFKASITLGPVRDAVGAVTGVTVILRDVTAVLSEHRELARALEASRAHLEQVPALQASLYEALGRRSWDTATVLDADLRVTYITPSVVRLLGYAPDQALRVTSWAGVVHPDDAPVAGEVLRRMLAEPGRTERFVLRLRHREGHWCWIEETVTNCLDDADIRGLVANLRDVSEQVRTEEALRLSEALHQALLETAQEGILAMAPDGTTSFANERMAQILGRPLAAVHGTDTLGLLGLTAWGAESTRVEVSYHHPDGRERILEVSRSPLPSTTTESLGSLVTVADVTEARLVETTLRRQALHDSLTGLPNRYLFLDRLETAAARHQRLVGRGTAVLYLDLDRFKPVNDGHGHAAGDELLCEVASRLAGAVRATDTVGRLGGDEFAIICEDTDEHAAVLVAVKILGELGRPIVRNGEVLQIGVSIGVATSPPHDFTDLLDRADGAMYRAKQLGGGRVTVARPDDVLGPDDHALTS
jgi:diguanylate cyclase (GGDEF)-like protein/PAS domain S-box-containing protein